MHQRKKRNGYHKSKAKLFRHVYLDRSFEDRKFGCEETHAHAFKAHAQRESGPSRSIPSPVSRFQERISAEIVHGAIVLMLLLTTYKPQRSVS
eukprot:scaffold12049_cov141-Skeletonema_menzelii.AAC.2